MENLIEGLATSNDHQKIRVNDLPELTGYMKPQVPEGSLRAVTLPSDGIDIDRCIQRFQRDMMLQALERTHGNKTGAANLIGLNRTTFIERMRRHGPGSLVPRRLAAPDGR